VLPGFSGYNKQKHEKLITKLPQNIPDCHKIYQIATKYTRLPQNIPYCNKHTKLPQNIPNCHKIYQNLSQITYKYTKLPQNIPNSLKNIQNGLNIHVSILTIPRPSKIYQKCEFWYLGKYVIWQPCQVIAFRKPKEVDKRLSHES
jgi:hypothetical protein